MVYSWNQIPGESKKAFDAFAIYRDLGKSRSIDKAWKELHPESKDYRAPKGWMLWCRVHHWVKRAAEFDKHGEDIFQKVLDEQIKGLAERQIQFRYVVQEVMEQRFHAMTAQLNKASDAPVTSIERTEETAASADGPAKTITTKVKGVSMSGEARLNMELRATGMQATGPEQKQASENAQPGPIIVEIPVLAAETPPNDTPSSGVLRQ